MGAEVSVRDGAPMQAWASAPDADLARVFQLAASIAPSLRGEQGGAPQPGALRYDGSTAATAPLKVLCRHWAEAYPEAGAHYVALRCWGLAIWQPVYLSVIASRSPWWTDSPAAFNCRCVRP
jgi:hypothetical protein